MCLQCDVKQKQFFQFWEIKYEPESRWNQIIHFTAAFRKNINSLLSLNWKWERQEAAVWLGQLVSAYSFYFNTSVNATYRLYFLFKGKSICVKKNTIQNKSWECDEWFAIDDRFEWMWCLSSLWSSHPNPTLQTYQIDLPCGSFNLKPWSD